MITIVKHHRREYDAEDHENNIGGHSLPLATLGFRVFLLACAFAALTSIFYLYLTTTDQRYGVNKGRSNTADYGLDKLFDDISTQIEKDSKTENAEDFERQMEEQELKLSEERRRRKKKKGRAKGKSNQKEDTVKEKLFAYYVLTPQCLSDELLMKTALGDGTQLDIYVNCFKSLCYDNLKPHVTYLLDTSTTWTTGRNMLYNYSKKRGRKYRYHIFLDDDVSLFYTKYIMEYAARVSKSVEDAYLLKMFEYDPEGLKEAEMDVRDGKSAWRTFENDLLTYSPAFATTNLLKLYGFESRSMQLRHWDTVCANTSVMPWITTTFFIDALFIAYHEEAMPLIFPYTEVYEKNWWVSAIIQTFRARELLYKQGMCNFKVAVLNRLHRNYPRAKIPNNIIKQYIKKDAPELKNVLDHRLLDYGPFLKWQHNEDFFYKDPSICTGPLKFPISKHYVVKGKQRQF